MFSQQKHFAKLVYDITLTLLRCSKIDPYVLYIHWIHKSCGPNCILLLVYFSAAHFAFCTPLLHLSLLFQGKSQTDGKDRKDSNVSHIKQTHTTTFVPD